MIWYDNITSKDYEDESQKEMLSKYIQQERKFRRRWNNYIDNTTLKYEELNRNAPVKVSKVKIEAD